MNDGEKEEKKPGKFDRSENKDGMTDKGKKGKKIQLDRAREIEKGVKNKKRERKCEEKNERTKK